ncbi:MAG: 50S ribosomal protein L15 [Candidatus Bathyarchaeota archaeon]|nr:50S ribosomal protein L15 [Candidatus Bathyarchaeota archaeon]
MPHKERKTRKMRGSRTHGYGRVGQHRDAGSKGQRKVGRHKHLWSYVTTHEPDYFGKHGFTSPQSLKRKENTINIKQLSELTAQTASENGKTNVNLTTLGYTKLLGTGKITKQLIVSVPSCSKSAEEKIKKAGGQVLTESQENGE